MTAKRWWVLGGGGARGAAQVGVLNALFEAGVDPPVGVVGTSVGSLNAAAIAAFPSLAGAQMLRQVWLSKLARDVFQADPVGLVLSTLRSRGLSALPGRNVERLVARTLSLSGKETFEQLRVPLRVVATDLNAGVPHVFSQGPLKPALVASTAIPGVFPAVPFEGRYYLDGGIVDNTALDIAVSSGAKHILAIDLMGGAETQASPASLTELIARTLQLALHHRMLSDFERLRRRARIVALCPVMAPTSSWNMKRDHVESMIDQARAATADLLRRRGSRLFGRSAIHYLTLS